MCKISAVNVHLEIPFDLLLLLGKDDLKGDTHTHLYIVYDLMHSDWPFWCVVLTKIQGGGGGTGFLETLTCERA